MKLKSLVGNRNCNDWIGEKNRSSDARSIMEIVPLCVQYTSRNKGNVLKLISCMGGVMISGQAY